MTEAPSGTVTILFTDIAASTSLTEQLGDAEFRQRARELDTLLRTAISDGGGRSVEGKLLGDGVLAVFSSAGRAIECAVRCCALAEGRGLPLHIGLHVGDVLQEGDNVFGGAVNLAARICAASAAGEVLVSDTVRSLARTSVAVRFEDRGQHVLKGIADSLRLYAVRPKEPGGWIDVEARGLRRLWANKAVRVAAAVLALGIIAGGSAGGLVLSGAIGGSGSSAGAEYRKLDFHIAGWRSTFQPVSGDCQSSDVIFRGVFGEPAVLTGDFAGHSTIENQEGILYLSDSCQWGFIKGTFTLTDQSGNTLSGATQSTINFLGVPDVFGREGPRAEIGKSADIITGGTGVYQGARGHGGCRVKGTSEPVTDTPGAIVTVIDLDCTYQVTPGGVAPADAEPVILELGAGAGRMTVFASPVDLPTKVYFNVQYFNPRDQMQTGLSLKLRAPKGAEMRAATRDEEEPAAGERVWALPDLAPGALGRLEFSVTFLSAETETVELVAEIDGEGFDPVRSDPLGIEVVQ